MGTEHEHIEPVEPAQRDLDAAQPGETKGPAERLKAFLRETLFLLPSTIHLVRGLQKDPRVPRKFKLLIFLFLGYLVCPVDLIPDWFPGIGHIDDWLLALVLLNALLDAVPEEVVREHWHHSWDIVGLARRLRPLMPTSVARQLLSWSGEAWRWGARQALRRLRVRNPASEPGDQGPKAPSPPPDQG